MFSGACFSVVRRGISIVQNESLDHISAHIMSFGSSSADPAHPRHPLRSLTATTSFAPCCCETLITRKRIPSGQVTFHKGSWHDQGSFGYLGWSSCASRPSQVCRASPSRKTNAPRPIRHRQVAPLGSPTEVSRLTTPDDRDLAGREQRGRTTRTRVGTCPPRQKVAVRRRDRIERRPGVRSVEIVSSAWSCFSLRTSRRADGCEQVAQVARPGKNSGTIDLGRVVTLRLRERPVPRGLSRGGFPCSNDPVCTGSHALPPPCRGPRSLSRPALRRSPTDE